MGTLRRWQQAAFREIWQVDLDQLPGWRRSGVFLVRLGYVVARDIAQGLLTLRAMSLVYTTLLSLVPLLAVSFSVLKAFGVQNQIEPLLRNFLAPMGARGVEIGDRVMGFVGNINAGVLGSLGLAFLFFTVVSLLQKVEHAFNFAWRVRQPRRLARRFSDYLSIVLVGPVLVFAALGITGSMMASSFVQSLAAIQPFGVIIEQIARITPYILIISAFTFVYIVIPNTRVRFASALVGGVTAGVLWQTAGWAFASFIVTSGKYAAIYSTFASLIMFLIWLYLAWLILLIGANVAFYHQNPEHMLPRAREYRMSIRQQEHLALMVMQSIARNLYQRQPPWSAASLAAHLHIPVDPLNAVIQALEHHGILQPTADEPPRYVAVRPLDELPVIEVLDAVRETAESAWLQEKHLPSGDVINDLIHRLDAARKAAAEDLMVKQLALAEALPKQDAASEDGGEPPALKA